MTLIDAVRSGDITVVQSAISAGADVNVADEDGYSALHWACQLGNTPIVKVLLNSGAHVDTPDNEGFRPLEVAINCKHPKVAAILLDYKPDLMNTRNGFSYLHACAAAGDERTLQRLLCASEVTSLINSRDNGGEGQTALHWAAQEGHTEIIEMLLNAGASPYITDDCGFVPLHIAVAEEHLLVVQLFYEKGVDINLKCRAWNNGTCLHFAYAWQKEELIHFLMKLGADDTIRDGSGKRPTELR